MESMDIVRLEYWNKNTGQFPVNPWKMSMEFFQYIRGNFPVCPWNFSMESMEFFHGIHGLFPQSMEIVQGISGQNPWTMSMEFVQVHCGQNSWTMSMEYFHGHCPLIKGPPLFCDFFSSIESSYQYLNIKKVSLSFCILSHDYRTLSQQSFDTHFSSLRVFGH